jgi:hypothetical protein
MTDEPRPLIDVIRTLARARHNAACARALVDALRQQWEENNAGYLDAATEAAATVRALEDQIRSRGAAIAEQTRQAPCPGTKVRNESVVQYYTYHPETGERVDFETANQNRFLVTYAVNQGWLSLIKPDRGELEKVLKRLPESTRPPWAHVAWHTVVSIDSDLSPLLENESAPEGSEASGA